MITRIMINWCYSRLYSLQIILIHAIFLDSCTIHPQLISRSEIWSLLFQPCYLICISYTVFWKLSEYMFILTNHQKNLSYSSIYSLPKWILSITIKYFYNVSACYTKLSTWFMGNMLVFVYLLAHKESQSFGLLSCFLFYEIKLMHYI